MSIDSEVSFVLPSPPPSPPPSFLLPLPSLPLMCVPPSDGAAVQVLKRLARLVELGRAFDVLIASEGGSRFPRPLPSFSLFPFLFLFASISEHPEGRAIPWASNRASQGR